jgi:hypothetical protein
MRQVQGIVFSFIVSLGLAVLLARPVSAQSRGFGPDPAHAPSVFSYGFRGLAIGIPVGLSAGYLLTDDDHWGKEDWKHVGIGAGIGAVTGAMGGLGVGFYDLYDHRPGVGMVVLRDTWYGVLLGASVGLIVGTIFWIDNGDAENALRGAAWGTVIGAPVGTVIGFIEGPTVRDIATLSPAPGVAFHVRTIRSPATALGASAHVTFVPTLSGAF